MLSTTRDATFSNERVVAVIGQTGVGKSSLLNAMAGKNMFETGLSMGESITTSPAMRRTTWKYHIEQTDEVYGRFIDTPGITGEPGDIRHTVSQILQFFEELKEGVSAIIVAVPVTDVRLDAYVQAFLKMLDEVLGRDFWNHVIIVFTKCDESDDDFEQRRNTLEHSVDGFAARIREQCNLSERYLLPTFFLSAVDLRRQPKMAENYKQLYNCILNLERGNRGRYKSPLFRRLIRSEDVRKIKEVVTKKLYTCLQQ